MASTIAITTPTIGNVEGVEMRVIATGAGGQGHGLYMELTPANLTYVADVIHTQINDPSTREQGVQAGEDDDGDEDENDDDMDINDDPPTMDSPPETQSSLNGDNSPATTSSITSPATSTSSSSSVLSMLMRK